MVELMLSICEASSGFNPQYMCEDGHVYTHTHKLSTFSNLRKLEKDKRTFNNLGWAPNFAVK